MTGKLEQVAKLLNQAENAGTPEEAETFMAAAQRIGNQYSIDLAVARHATIDKQKTKPVQRDVFIGTAGSRGLRTLVDLYLGIAKANDIKCTIAHNATRVYSVGFAEDLDLAEALFASLQVQQAKFAEMFRKDGAWKTEKVFSEQSWSYKPITWLTARLNFQAAFASRVGHRLYMAAHEDELERERQESELKSRPHLNEDGALNPHFKDWFFDRHGLDLDGDDATAADFTRGFQALRNVLNGGVFGIMFPDDLEDGEWFVSIFEDYLRVLDSMGDAGTALVLVEKRAAVDEAYAPLSARARGTYRGGTSGSSSPSSLSAGRAAGDRARLGGSAAIGGTRGALTK